MLIANPIYDTFFKYMIANSKTAKFFIETLLEKKVIDLQPIHTEKVIHTARELSVIRYDYACTIELEHEQTKEKVKKTIIVELQKNKNELDIGRFRSYIAKHYNDNRIIETTTYNNEKIETVEYLPIIAIYFLGFNLNNPQPFIKAENKLINLETKEIIDTPKDEFIEKLTHDSYFIQIKRITSKNEDKLSKIFQMFNQEYKIDKDSKNNKSSELGQSKYIEKLKNAYLEIPEESILEENKNIFNDLHNMLEKDEVIHDYEEAQRIEMYLAKQEKESFIDGIIEGEKLGLERGEKLGLEKGKIEERLEIARSLKAKGFHDVMISEVTGLTFEEIKNII